MSAPQSLKPCPVCQRISTAEYAPFCTKRCADIDLSRWFKGVYAVPVVEAAENPDEHDGGDDGEL
jgi:uncharacterized protein